jgi:hypothetical protein
VTAGGSSTASRAVVRTDRPERYGKQLVLHLLARHLVRFGERDRLSVTWQHDPAAAESADPSGDRPSEN